MTLEGTQDTMLASIPFVKDFGPSFFSKSLKVLVIDFPLSTWSLVLTISNPFSMLIVRLGTSQRNHLTGRDTSQILYLSIEHVLTTSTSSSTNQIPRELLNSLFEN